MLNCYFPERVGVDVEVEVEVAVVVGAAAAAAAAVGADPGAGPGFGFVVVRVLKTVELGCLDMAAVRGCSAEVNLTESCHFSAAQFVH